MTDSESSSYESVTNNLEEELNDADIDNRAVNILLFGENGVGKSTFINAFANYLRYSNLETAMENDLITVIPTKFTIVDENYEERVIEIESTLAERHNIIETQYCKSYVFPLRQGDLNIRFINTPGNFKHMLSYVSDIKHLNAICVLLKPNVSRLTVEFEYSIKQLLSTLDKSACNNLVFVFTNIASTFYRPGETLPTLKKCFEEISSVTIPLSKDTNVFCMDNDGFRCLAASKCGITFDRKSMGVFSKNWKKSSEEFSRMIQYVAGGGPNSKIPLEPYMIENMISINKARDLILRLSQPLADVTLIILDNIFSLHKHSASLDSSSNNLAELKTKLNIPVIDLIVTPLDQPTTVCTSPGCSKMYEVNNMKKWHYKQKCHDPCYLQNVPKEIIGSPELMHCAAMGAEYICIHCNCSYLNHMHIYYELRIGKNEMEVPENEQKITYQDLIDKIRSRLNEYENEKNIILKTMAKFAYFLNESAIMKHSDGYQSYLIDRKNSLNDHANAEIIWEYTKTLARYELEKRMLRTVFQQRDEDEAYTITANDVMNYVSALYNLKHNGDKIKLLVVCNKIDIPKEESIIANNEEVYDASRNVTNELHDDESTSNFNQPQKQSRNCNQNSYNHKATNTCQGFGLQNYNINIYTNCSNNCQHTNCQATEENHENAVPVGRNACLHFHIYGGVISQNKSCP